MTANKTRGLSQIIVKQLVSWWQVKSCIMIIWTNCHCCREDSKMRQRFFQHMVEDRTESSMSYYEFLQFVQQKVKGWCVPILATCMPPFCTLHCSRTPATCRPTVCCLHINRDTESDIFTVLVQVLRVSGCKCRWTVVMGKLRAVNVWKVIVSQCGLCVFDLECELVLFWVKFLHTSVWFHSKIIMFLFDKCYFGILDIQCTAVH